jgi:hypothetical protein
VVEKGGYQTKNFDNLQILPEQANPLNVQLQIANVAQTVTVDASKEALMDTQGGSIGGVISGNEVQSMPTFGRDVFQLAELAPGSFADESQGSGGGTFSLPATKGPGGPSANGGIFQTENGPQVLANGGQYEDNGISIDGISTASAVWGGTTVVSPTEESVANVNVVTNSYDAEDGRFSGAQIEVTSKSGSNTPHGSAFFQRWSPGLNAYQRYNGPGFYSTGTPSSRGLLRDQQQFNQYGGSLGGPLWRNRLFAFFAYEAERSGVSQVTANGWYDTPAFDKLAPSGSIASSYLSYPGEGVNGTLVPSQSTCGNLGLAEGKNCNTIAGQGVNVGTPLTSGLGKQDTTWQSASNPGVGNGLSTSVADLAYYTTNDPTTISDDQYNGRVDADVTGRDHATFAIYWTPVSQTYYMGPVRPQNLWHHDVINDAFSLIWNHTFSASFLNEARANAAGWRFNEIASNPQAPFGLPTDTVAAISGNAIQNFGGQGPSHLDQWTYGYRDVATKIIGQHSIKFGGEVTRLYYLNDAPYAARPNFGFFNVWDFLNDAPNTESGTFNPATGIPTEGRQDDREDIWGFFVQDDWKVKPNLTFNLGLRYNYLGPLSAKQGDLYSVSLGTGTTTLSGMSIQRGGNLWQPQKGNFGPEIGFAYSPGMLHNRLVVRGGFGLNYNQEEIAISANVFQNPGLQIQPNFTMSTPSSPNPGIVYSTASSVHSLYGYAPNPNAKATFSSNGLPTGSPVQVYALDNNLPTMYTEHYSLQTEFNAGHQWVATAGYQGSISRHTFFQYDENAVASVEDIALNPEVNSIIYYGNNGTGNYSAGLAELRHQFSQHFLANAQFTWAKSMDTSSEPYVFWYYPYNPSLSYGPSDYNVGKDFRVYALWQPAIFHGSHNWMEKVVGGWSLSGIFNLHSGFPWSPIYSVSGDLYCSTCGSYSTLFPGAYLGGAGRSTSNNAYKSGVGVGNGVNQNFPNGGLAYFKAPTYKVGPEFPATGGTTPQPPGIARNSWEGPGYKDLDGTLSKSFGLPRIPGLGENAKFEFRADVFNFFNNLNFEPGGISTGGGIQDNITSTNFGQGTKALGSRMVTMQGRFTF